MPQTASITKPHARSAPTVLGELNVDPARGLSASEADERRRAIGDNELTDQRGRSAWTIFSNQFRNPLVWLLLGAACVSIAVGEVADVIAILTIVVLNAALGFFQEFKAETALTSLRRMSQPIATVLRDGEWTRVAARELTIGDIFRLEAGNQTPADGRIIESVHLQIDEAPLTGESLPISKETPPLPEETALADRTNCVYLGTTVSSGRGTAVVVAIGMATELGRIAGMLQRVEREESSLQSRLARLSLQLTWVGVALVAAMIAGGLLAGHPPRMVVMTALSMAVAVIPEGLAAAVTVVLALGTRRMLERHALIRRLSAIEALGTVTVVCTDKTGTLTLGRMEVSSVVVANAVLNLVKEQPPSAADRDAIRPLLAVASLCNDAAVDQSHVGDATEVAIVESAVRAGIDVAELRSELPRIEEVAFDSIRKRMSTVHAGRPVSKSHPLSALLKSDGSEQPATLICVKGSLESLLSVCRRSWDGIQGSPLTDEVAQSWHRRHDALAQGGARVLAVAVDVRTSASADPHAIERDLILLGLLGLTDPARPEVSNAIAQCHQAGIRPVMMTGDHPLTAQAIGNSIGLKQATPPPTSTTLSKLSDAEFSSLVSETNIFARVTPEDKLRIVQALQQQGEVVAMTGDGVNDAPALRQATVGIAMGLGGTDVAKDSADVVLLDDNFSSIVAAIAEGRVIYRNIVRFLKFLLASNAGELWVMILALLAGMPLPLLPLQILWINLVTDGFPALGLAFERGDGKAMSRPPRSTNEPLLSREMAFEIFWIGLLMGVVSLAAGGSWRAPPPADEARWRTMIFSVLTLSQLGNALALRSSSIPLWRLGLFSNPLLLTSVATTCALQLAVVYTPFLQRIFSTTPLNTRDMVICPLLGSVVFLILELRKVVRRPSPNGPLEQELAGKQ